MSMQCPPQDGPCLEVVHETAYRYSQPVALSHHVAHLEPLSDEGQHLEAFDLAIQPPPVARRPGIDAFGNACLHFALSRPHTELVVRSRSLVRLAPRFDGLEPEAGPAWEVVRDRLRYVARAPFDPAVAFVQPSPFVPRLEELARVARASFVRGRPVASAALDLMHRVFAEFDYRSQSTDVDTPVARVLESRTGVCQDFAHVAIGACRMMGVPARYVSGYLLTGPLPGGGPGLVGADASHAWLQVYCPGTPGCGRDGWLDLDPTNDIVPATEHVRLAVGRDFGDVTPLRGVIRGGGRHRLSVAVTTRPCGAAGSA